MSNEPNLFYVSIVFVVYFVPAIVAWRRGHRNEYAIGILNTFLGWTVIGWVVALIWAYTDNVRPRNEATREA